MAPRPPKPIWRACSVLPALWQAERVDVSRVTLEGVAAAKSLEDYWIASVGQTRTSKGPWGLGLTLRLPTVAKISWR